MSTEQEETVMSISELILPRTSDAMSEAILAAWLVDDESEVSADDVVAEVETEKAMVEVLAGNDGLLVKAVQSGATVEVGGVLAFVLSGADINEYRSGNLKLRTDQSGSADAAPSISAPPTSAPPASQETHVDLDAPALIEVPLDSEQDVRRLVSSPLARKLAREAGLDLAKLTPGSGPGGRIVRADIESARTQSAETQVASLTSRQRAMATAMVQSTTSIPHFSISRDISLDSLVQFRMQMKRVELDPPSLSAFFVRALAVAMLDTPASRVSWVADGIATHPDSAIGVAIADGDSDLVVPVIRQAESKSLWSIGKEIQALGDDVRDRRLRPDQLKGAIGTISNLGMFGIDALTPIIPPGQTFIIGIGQSRKRLAYDSAGRIAEETYMTVTLSGDHRVLTGLGAARLLTEFATVCENPILLLDRNTLMT